MTADILLFCLYVLVRVVRDERSECYRQRGRRTKTCERNRKSTGAISCNRGRQVFECGKHWKKKTGKKKGAINTGKHLQVSTVTGGQKVFSFYKYPSSAFFAYYYRVSYCTTPCICSRKLFFCIFPVRLKNSRDLPAVVFVHLSVENRDFIDSFAIKDLIFWVLWRDLVRANSLSEMFDTGYSISSSVISAHLVITSRAAPAAFVLRGSEKKVRKKKNTDYRMDLYTLQKR